MVRLAEDPVRRVLKDFGLTEKEVTTYVFVAKHGPMKGGEIAKLTKTQKAQTYRMLKSLQSKGLVETTLESPARFAAVQFEKFIDLNIKTKQEEALLLEKTKSALLEHWRKTGTFKSEPTIEKFATIEGKQKIYPKIAQMVKETKNQFSAMVNIHGLALADQYGFFESVTEHSLKSNVQFHLLVELDGQSLGATKSYLKRIPKIPIHIKARNTDIGLRLLPRVVVRDDEEILLFITPRTSINEPEQDMVCLWTNCRELLSTFKTFFEDVWRNSSDIEREISNINADRAATSIPTVGDAEVAKKKYEEILASAEKEITILTSSEGLLAYYQKEILSKKVAKNKIAVKLMAPITNHNLKAAEELSKFCEVRHVPPNFLQTTIVDGKHLFQFGQLTNYRWTVEDRNKSADFDDIRYSDDLVRLLKMKSLLEDVWRDATIPSKVTLDSILGSEQVALQQPGFFQPISAETPQVGLPTHCSARAVIHMPTHLGMPDLLIDITHFGEPNDEKSNWMSVATWLKTSKGYAFIPAAVVLSRGDKNAMTNKIENTNRAMFAGTPAAQNVLVVREHELQVWMKNNTLFVGWTVPIPILPPKYVLPPSFLLFEGYGNSTHRRTISNLPSGYRTIIETNGVEAFVTFMSPSARYTGPGTEGRIYNNGLIKIEGPA